MREQAGQSSCVFPTTQQLLYVLRAFFYTNRRKGLKVILKFCIIGIEVKLDAKNL